LAISPKQYQSLTRLTDELGKQAKLIEMLRTDEGATIAEIVAVTGWMAHTARGVISGVLKKKLGLAITATKVEGRGSVYRIC